MPAPDELSLLVDQLDSKPRLPLVDEGRAEAVTLDGLRQCVELSTG